MDTTGQDRITVERDGEEIEVFNHVSVINRHYINSVNGHESFAPIITSGDSDERVDVVTERVADYLWHEWGIEAEKQGIEVIDPEDEEVTVL